MTTPVFAAVATDTPVTIYVAKEIITMDPSQPSATAVAVKDGPPGRVLNKLPPYIVAGIDGVFRVDNLYIEQPRQQHKDNNNKDPGNNIAAFKKTIHLRSFLLKNNKPEINIKNTVNNELNKTLLIVDSNCDRLKASRLKRKKWWITVSTTA